MNAVEEERTTWSEKPIDLSGLDIAEVLRRLYNHGKPPKRIDFDYVHGRPMKFRFELHNGRWILDRWELYDRDQGVGAAAFVVSELRAELAR